MFTASSCIFLGLAWGVKVAGFQLSFKRRGLPIAEPEFERVHRREWSLPWRLAFDEDLAEYYTSLVDRAIKKSRNEELKGIRVHNVIGGRSADLAIRYSPYSRLHLLDLYFLGHHPTYNKKYIICRIKFYWVTFLTEKRSKVETPLKLACDDVRRKQFTKGVEILQAIKKKEEDLLREMEEDRNDPEKIRRRRLKNSEKKDHVMPRSSMFVRGFESSFKPEKI